MAAPTPLKATKALTFHAKADMPRKPVVCAVAGLGAALDINGLTDGVWPVATEEAGADDAPWLGAVVGAGVICGVVADTYFELEVDDAADVELGDEGVVVG